MARIRTIKPDAFTSDSLSSVSVLARWTFAGLWTHCDDDGRCRSDARLIKAALFPIDDATTLKHLSGALDELEEIGCICRYEVDGRGYLHCPNFGEHQRINRRTRSTLPECPRSNHGGLSEDSLSGHGGYSSGREGKGRERERSSADAEGAFTDFWSLYPRKVAKGAARKAWAKALKSTDAESIITALKAQLPAWQQSDPKFVPHAATWLNGERWADEQSSVTPQHSWATALEVGYCGTCGGDVDIDGTGHHDGCPKRRRA